jgi:hypothetical protein
LGSRVHRRRPKFRDQPQDIGEQTSRNRDLGHLEGDIAAVADDLRADLDQLYIPLATVEAQEDETILDNGFSGHGLVRFVHPDPPRLIGSR